MAASESVAFFPSLLHSERTKKTIHTWARYLRSPGRQQLASIALPWPWTGGRCEVSRTSGVPSTMLLPLLIGAPLLPTTSTLSLAATEARAPSPPLRSRPLRPCWFSEWMPSSMTTWRQFFRLPRGGPGVEVAFGVEEGKGRGQKKERKEEGKKNEKTSRDESNLFKQRGKKR